MRRFELERVRQVLRSLGRSPGFVAVAVLSLGVALGLTAASFAIVDGTMHRQVLFADPGRLFSTNLRYGNRHNGPSIAAQVRAVAVMPAVQDVGVSNGETVYLKGGGVPRPYVLEHVTPNLFSLLGVRLRTGRYPTPAEIHAERAVVVSERLWAEMFADRPRIGDATLDVAGHVYSIVGVVPFGDAGPLSADVVVPYAAADAIDGIRWGRITVRLRPAFDSTSVKPQLAAVAARLTRQYVPPTSASPPYLLQLDSSVPQPPKLSQNLFALMLTVIAFGVLLIGCTNVTALALARGLTKRRDHALRIALGASRGAVAMDILAEVTVIALAGAAVGAVVSVGLVGVLRHMVPEDMARWGMFVPRLSPRVFEWSLAALGGAMLIAGGVPAWRASRVSPADPLKDHAGTTTGRTRNEFRMLVIAELAVAMVLLMLTSLVALSTRNMIRFDFGFDTGALLDISTYGPTGDANATMREHLRFEGPLLARIRAIPGIRSATLSGVGIPENGEVTPDAIGELAPLPRQMYLIAGPGFFVTAGIPLVRGRDVAESDAHAGAVVLSQSAARALFPHGGAVGHMLRLGSERSSAPWVPIVGVAKDVYLGLSDDPTDLVNVFVDPPASFVPELAATRTFNGLNIIAAARHVTPALVRAVEGELQDAAPADVAVSVVPWTSFQAAAVRENRFFERLLSGLSFAALVLGVVGLFSVLSYSVGQRMREFAVRQALGATPMNIVRVVLKGAFEMALGGTAVGALLSFWASAGLSSQLFGVKNTDPVSLVIAEATLLAVALAAALVPAVRAMRADPVEILRST